MSKMQPDIPSIVSIELKYAVYQIHFPLTPSYRFVRTTFPDGLFTDGSRDYTDPGNIREAKSQGYTPDNGKDPVWSSLVDHELLHSIVAEVIFDRPSVVLRTEAGGEFNPLWERYEEETIILAFQCYLNDIKSGRNPIINPRPIQDRIYRLAIMKRFKSLTESVYSLISL